jgi:anti-sigma regulatory factor (Ser/Thr protein kinase)
VSFHDRDSWYSRPAATVTGWRRLLDEATGRGQVYVRIVGEVGFGPPERHPTWTRYESSLNSLFAGTPAWIVCPYDRRILPPTVLADARRTHPVLHDGHRADSADYLRPEDLLRSVPEPAPVPPGAPRLELAVGPDVAALRRAVRDAVHGRPDRVDDLILAVSEVATNAIRHGHGRRALRLWQSGAVVVAEVSDEGPGPADPLAGLRPPVAERSGGRGLWLVHQLCDAVAVHTDGGRTQVRFSLTLR